MCDTIVALGNSTVDGAVIFAKNSDREPNEAHLLELVAGADHRPGSDVQCTYIGIPQVEHTHAVLLARPFWIWGAEMGVNEHGVTIGNEAVFTRVPYDKRPGLIGMDLLRLGLERGSTALEALQVITGLLENHGQGGNCGLTHGFYYHNSFLIADPRQAWVLETAGKQWAARQVRDVYSISNAITIENEWDLCSVGLVDHAVAQGWLRRGEEFSFARCYSDPLYTRFSDARKRQCATTDALRASGGKLNVEAAMQMLRAHTPGRNGSYSPDHGLVGADVCMHAGFGPVRNSQSAGSMVSRLGPEGMTHWFTAASAPCTGIFFPVWMDAGLPQLGASPNATFDPASYWWQHEELHRAVLEDYATRLPLFAAERDALEGEFLRQAAACEEREPAVRLEFSNQCVQRAGQARARWLERVGAAPRSRRRSLAYALAWRQYNRQARFPA